MTLRFFVRVLVDPATDIDWIVWSDRSVSMVLAGSSTLERSVSGTSPLVLVVDDELYIVNLLTELLEDEGYRVVTARDGIVALDVAAKMSPDLVLADIMMPRLDGLALLSRMREQKQYDRVPVILMSAAVTPLTQEAPYISKPFDLDDLLDVVEQQLEAYWRPE
jgi:CheY-like chemotaxis protein